MTICTRDALDVRLEVGITIPRKPAEHVVQDPN